MVLAPFLQAFLPNVPTKEMKSKNHQVFPPILTPQFFPEPKSCSIIFSKMFPMFPYFFHHDIGTKGSDHAGDILHGGAGSLRQVLGLRLAADGVAKDQNDAKVFPPLPYLVDKELARPLRDTTLQTTCMKSTTTTNDRADDNDKSSLSMLRSILLPSEIFNLSILPPGTHPFIHPLSAFISPQKIGKRKPVRTLKRNMGFPVDPQGSMPSPSRPAIDFSFCKASPERQTAHQLGMLPNKSQQLQDPFRN